MLLPHRLWFHIQKWPERKIKRLSGSSIHAYLCNWTYVKKYMPVSQKLKNSCIKWFPRPVNRWSQRQTEFSLPSVTGALGTDTKLITTIKSSKEIGDSNMLQMLKPPHPPFRCLVALPILRSTNRLLRNICPPLEFSYLTSLTRQNSSFWLHQRYKAKNRRTRILLESRKTSTCGVDCSMWEKVLLNILFVLNVRIDHRCGGSNAIHSIMVHSGSNPFRHAKRC